MFSKCPGNTPHRRQSYGRASAAGLELRTNVRLNHARLYVANAAQIKLERQAKATLRLPANGYENLAEYLSGSSSAISDAAFRDTILAEESLVVIFGAEFDGASLGALVKWGLGRENVKFAFLGDHAKLTWRSRHGPPP